MKYWLCISGMILIVACKNTPKTTISTDIPAEHIDPTSDQAARRHRSEAYCQAHGIPIYKNPNAMFVDGEAEGIIRSQDSVVDRAIALFFICLKSEGLEKPILDSLADAWHIGNKLSEKERLYATTSHPTEEQRTQANWRYEDLHVLLWSLGFVDTLFYPDHQCDVTADAKIIRDLGLDGMRKKARLRSKKEILDQADLILRLDWACVDARTKNQDAPGKLDSGVVYERHYVLNWLTLYEDADWDDIACDT